MSEQVGLTHEMHKTLNWMNYNEIKGLLESFGMQCHPHESENDLREALIENILDGTIPEDCIV